MTWTIGCAKADITPKTRGISMLGYGHPENIATGVETPISARALYLTENNKKLLIINFEICFITDSLRKTLLNELNKIEPFAEEQLLISAQHTHSAPSGYTHYAFYNMPTPGFVQEVLDSYVQGALKAYKVAKDKKQKASLEYAKSAFDNSVPVSFNRSMNAYLQNPEAKEGVFGTEQISAVDKYMRAFVIKNDQGRLLSAINWFAVHTTSLRNTNKLITPDNKGYAALNVEKEFDQDFVAIFAQGDAGDVSPNWIWDKKLKVMRAQFEDQFENARFSAKLQSNKLMEIINANEGHKVESRLDSVLCYQDFSNIKPDKEFLPSDAPEYASTTSACFGVAFTEGAKEGPGASLAVNFLLKFLATFVKFTDFIKSLLLAENERKQIWNFYNNQGAKSIFAETGNKRILGVTKLDKLSPLSLIDKMVGTLASFYENGSMREHTWTQHVLPVQLIRLGEILIVATPAEVTTVAAHRIKKQLLEMFKDKGVTEVISSPYSNSFCGYVVTPEEYDIQCYEGGHCVFGKWTLPAFQTVIKKLALEMLKEEAQRDLSWSIATPDFSQEELASRSYGNQ